MAKEGFQETTVTEDIMKALTLDGSLARQGLTELITGKQEIGAFDDIFAGKKEVTASDFAKTLESEFGIDITSGDNLDPSKRTLLDNSVNFTRDVLLDIATSPSSLVFGAPAKGAAAVSKLANIGKIASKLDNFVPLTKAARVLGSPTAKAFALKSAERAATGGTLGLMSIQEDDDAIESIQKVMAGAAIGVAGAPALMATAKAVNNVGNQALDAIGRRTNSKTFDAFQDLLNERLLKRKEVFPEKEISQFENRALKSAKRIKGRERDYHRIVGKFDREFDESLIASGLTESERLAKRLQFDELMTDGFSDFTSLRNAKKEQLIESGMSKREAFAQATEQMDEVAAENLLKKVQLDEDLFNATKQWFRVNKELAGLYNETVYSRALELADGSRAQKDQLRRAFYPIKTHTLDFKSLDDEIVQNLSGKINDKGGSRMRLSEIVTDAKGKITPEELRQIGAERYSRLYLTDQEVIARDIVSDISMNKKRIQSMTYEDILNGTAQAVTGNTKAMDVARKTLYAHDQLLQHMKTGYLVSRISWLKTNYIDNVSKAYIANGAETAAKVAVMVPANVTGAVTDKLTGGMLSSLIGENTLQKLMRVIDPQSSKGAAVVIDRQFLDAAGEFGAIDVNKFVDFKKMPTDNPEIYKMISGSAENVNLMNTIEARKGLIEKGADSLSDMYWGTAGKIGSGIESMTRYIVFKDNAMALRKKYPLFDGVIKEGRLSKVLDASHKVNMAKSLKGLAVKSGREDALSIASKRIMEVRETRAALSEASRLTNDILFDYSDLSQFENHVMKRIFPFWSFTSKNTALYLDKAFDGIGSEGRGAILDNIFKSSPASRIVKSTKILSQGGRLPDKDQRKELPYWMREKGVRIDGNGNVVFQTPESSAMDAMRIVSDPTKMGEAINPIFKSTRDLLANEDSFTGRQILPNPRKTTVTVQEGALSLLGDDALEKLDVYRNPNTGELRTANAASALLFRAIKDATPLIKPAMLDDFARGIKKARFVDGKEGWDVVAGAIDEILSPLKTRTVSESQKKRNVKEADRQIRKAGASNSEEMFSRDKKKKKKAKRSTLRRRINRRKSKLGSGRL